MNDEILTILWENRRGVSSRYRDSRK